LNGCRVGGSVAVTVHGPPLDTHCTVLEGPACIRLSRSTCSLYLWKSNLPFVQRPSILRLSTIKPAHGRVIVGSLRLM
jgi:hypothetical protein